MMRGSLKYWLALGVLGAAFFGWSVVRANRPARSVPDENEAAAASAAPLWTSPVDFKLTNERGEDFDSASLKGRVWVGSFFFTNCPAICWRMNQALAELGQTLGKRDVGLSDVRFVSITCDPANDTPEALSRYAERFHADPEQWTFLTGEMSALRDLANRQFHVALDKGMHSDRVFAVDRSGRIRAMFSLTESGQSERLQKLLAKLEAEPASP